MLKIFEDYDWSEACVSADLNPDDVAEVFDMEEGENDGNSWLMLGRLKDDSFFFMSAWCDYTGWDCQSGGDLFVDDDFEYLLRYCMTNSDRRRLGIELENLL